MPDRLNIRGLISTSSFSLHTGALEIVSFPVTTNLLMSVNPGDHFLLVCKMEVANHPHFGVGLSENRIESLPSLFSECDVIPLCPD